MIDRIDSATVEQLAERTDGPWISIYLPTDRIGPSTPSKTRLKNLLAEAVATMKSRGMNTRLIASVARRGDDLLADNSFWATQHDGLAVFLSPTDRLTFRLPEACDQEVLVTDTPDVMTLRTFADRDRPFAVLALSLKNVRLFRGDQQSLVEVDPPVLPVSLDEALDLDDRESQLQSHTGGRVGGGQIAPAFHGQGSKDRADVDRFLRLVDRALGQAVAADVPIVLAGVDRLVAAFRHVSHREGLIDDAIHGNADRSPAPSLHEKAWPIVQRAFSE
jgi:hypothetical protein